ncbi:MAG: 30S ribosomal protein S9 [Deltaproteobacteria bacterium]|nr:30S ribosomal protein S9 [Deltaproteobacteria bacterium]MBW1947374.1 30S ribosomal protein S9 [Deltaproteobacteria bacterium]MBW1966528.1 30S ribosomal protein S9 [Deltaproteobacteria bacterium]MBW2099011.1 30S ribosomal protein S9 [Deltaproteobacteria bacterium]PXF55150.1 MAG: 30S ribosomal protein S9 [Deltaproteobacteria bacterium]
MEQTRYYATGKRKTARARVWISPGEGRMTANGKPFDEYFDVDTARLIAEQPFVVTNTVGKYDVMIKVKGGGKSGQSEAVRHSIARALIQADEGYRIPLKKAGFLTRDAREKERKKYGLAGARKRYQYSKR